MPVSVVIPTIGRETLRATLASVAPQLERGDEVLVVGDGRPARAREIVARERRARWRYFETEGPCNDAGGTQRDLAATVARGDHLCFMDDDDVFTPDALAAIRGGIAEHPERVLLFRMDNYGTLRWRDREIRYGNVGTPMVVVPNDPARLPSWRFGDYEFIRTRASGSASRSGVRNSLRSSAHTYLADLPDLL